MVANQERILILRRVVGSTLEARWKDRGGR